MAPEKRVSAFRPWELMINVVGSSSLILPRTRRRIYRWGGLDVETYAIRPGCIVHTAKLRIGPRVIVGPGCHFENREWIEVGAGTGLGPETMILTSTHKTAETGPRYGEYDGAPVKIGENCWIGARVLILPGVTIGDGCVIAAGSVVTSNCADDGVYAGVPARRLRNLVPGADVSSSPSPSAALA